MTSDNGKLPPISRPSLTCRAGVPLPDYSMVWRIGGKIWQWERIIGRSDAILKNRMESEGLCDISDSMGWIASDYLFLSLREMHCGTNITKIVSDRSGSGNEKSDGIWANMIESHPITFVNTNAIKLFKIGQWDAGLNYTADHLRFFFIRRKFSAWSILHPIFHSIRLAMEGRFYPGWPAWGRVRFLAQSSSEVYSIDTRKTSILNCRLVLLKIVLVLIQPFFPFL